MKKIYLVLMAMIAGTASFAQAIPNSGMETWRNSTAGTLPIISVHAPSQWYGFDSLVIWGGETGTALGVLPGGGIDWKAQMFEESTIKHSGTRSAKLMTLKQDTVGLLPGSLSNASVSVSIAKVLADPTDILGAVTFSGGSPATSRIDTVKAWVEYFAGVDTITHMMGGHDSGTITVQSYARIASKDSLIGAGFAYISPTATFKEIAVPVIYTDTVDSVTFVRIIFASSGGAIATLDSSTLYVDDVTMSGKAYKHTPLPGSAVTQVSAANNIVKVYPNPATGTLYLDGPKNAGLNCKLFSIHGQLVMTRTLTGNDAIDISTLAAGSYIYTITDAAGSAVQNGKVAVSK